MSNSLDLDHVNNDDDDFYEGLELDRRQEIIKQQRMDIEREKKAF